MALSELEESSKSAKKVLDMALASCSQKSVLNELYVSKAGLELKHGSSDNALWTLSLMAQNRPFEPCKLNKLELLAFAHKSFNDLEDMTFKSIPQYSEDYHQSVPSLANNVFMTRLFGLCWMSYLTQGSSALENISNKLLSVVTGNNVLIFREVIHQVKTDILLHYEKSQKLGKYYLKANFSKSPIRKRKIE